MPILQFKQCFALVVEAQPDSQTWGKWPGGAPVVEQFHLPQFLGHPVHDKALRLCAWNRVIICLALWTWGSERAQQQ